MVVDEIDTDSSVADYSIELESQIIYLKIQDAFQPKSIRPDNLAEREYVSVIIDSFSNYLIEYGFKPEAKKLLNEKKEIIESCVPLGPKKKIISLSSRENFVVDSTNLPPVRYVQKYEEKFFEYALKEIKDGSSLIHKDFIEEFEKHGFPKKAVKNWILSEPKKVELLLNHLKPVFSSIAENYKNILSSENVSDWIKTGHVNVLKKTISPDIRISLYKKMNYSIREVPGNNLILGDSAILFKVNGEKRYKTFTDKEDNILAILLPLSPKRLLTGCVDEKCINYDELQTKIASNSLEYFIASDKNEKFLSLQKMVGKEAYLLTEGEIEELVKETFTG